MARVTTKATSNLSSLTAEERQERAEARRLVSAANKRIRRLEEQDLGQSSPAYRSRIKNGDPYFSVKGKSMKEVRRLTHEMENFMNMSTSTLRGAKENVTKIANRINITKNMNDMNALINDVNEFFETVDIVREYLENTKEIGTSIGYAEIWDVVSEQIEEMGGELGESIDEVSEAAIQTLMAATDNTTREALEEAHKQFMSDY